MVIVIIVHTWVKLEIITIRSVKILFLPSVVSAHRWHIMRRNDCCYKFEFVKSWDNFYCFPLRKHCVQARKIILDNYRGSLVVIVNIPIAKDL